MCVFSGGCDEGRCGGRDQSEVLSSLMFRYRNSDVTLSMFLYCVKLQVDENKTFLKKSIRYLITAGESC